INPIVQITAGKPPPKCGKITTLGATPPVPSTHGISCSAVLSIHSMSDRNPLLEAVNSQSAWLATTLRDLVLVESPSDDTPAVDEAVRLVADLAKSIGGRVKLHRQKRFGDILELRFGPARGGRKPILLLGHL